MRNPYHSGISGRSAKTMRAALFSLLLIASAAACAAAPRMGPAMEKDVRKLLGSNSKKHPLPPGWKISAWEIHDTKFNGGYITTKIASVTGAEATVRLAYSATPPKGVQIGETHSFRVEIENMKGAGAERAARAIFERIRNNDKDYFFSHKNMESPDLRLNHVLREHIYASDKGRMLFFSILALIATTLTLAAFIRRDIGFAPSGTVSAVMLVTIVAAGFIVRLYYAPRAPLHCNSHGIREIRAYTYHASPEESELNYGEVFPAFVKWLLGFTKGTSGDLFIMNLIFGSLAALSMFMITRSMTGSDPPALLAALLMALSPAMVWISGTESQIPAYLFTALLGLSAFAAAAEKQSAMLLWLAAPIIAFACSSRILTALLLPATCLILLYKLPLPVTNRRADFIKHAVAALLLIALWTFLHYSTIPKMTGKGWSNLSAPKIIHAFLHRENILWDPSLTILAVPVLSIAGLLISWRRNPRLAITAITLFLILVPLSFIVIDCRTTALRYQAQNHWIYFLMAGMAFSQSQNTRQKLSSFALACVIAAVIANSIYGINKIKSGDEEINEYRFIKKFALELPRETVIRLPVSDTAGQKLISDFPDYLGKHTIARGAAKAQAGRGEIVYIGLDCYRYVSRKEQKQRMSSSGMRHECATACPGKYKTLSSTTLDASTNTIGFQKRFHDISITDPKISFIKCY